MCVWWGGGGVLEFHGLIIFLRCPLGFGLICPISVSGNMYLLCDLEGLRPIQFLLQGFRSGI